MTENRAGERLARWACVLFACMLLASAWFKAIGPSYTASTLAWTGLDLDARHWLVRGSVVGEALLGSAILWWGGGRWIYSVSLLSALALTVLHSVSLFAADGVCGCFGERIVPEWIVFAGLGLGGLGSWHLLRSRAPQAAVRIRPVLRGLFTCGVLAAVLVPIIRASVIPPTDRLLESAKLGSKTTEALFVIGSFSCGPCHDALWQIDRARVANASLRQLKIYFVTSQDRAFDLEQATEFSWLYHQRVPASLWDGLTESGVPCFYHYRRGEAGSLRLDWRAQGMGLAK